LRTIKQKSVLGVFLQRVRVPAGGDGIHQPDFCAARLGCRTCRDRQRAAAAAVAEMILTESNLIVFKTKGMNRKFSSSEAAEKSIRLGAFWKVASIFRCQY